MLKALHLWLPAYLRRRRRTHPVSRTHLILGVCDHFEPLHGATQAEAVARVGRWAAEYPELASTSLDSTGQQLRHTFFYPIEQYDSAIIDPLAALCRASRCEVEIHLHHKNDSAANLATTLDLGKRHLATHGLLSTDPAGAIRYGFIHGDWALDNSHPSGAHCGVSNELRVLAESGCYADFTLPSAPEHTQTSTINAIYYAQPTSLPKSHDRGRKARVGSRPSAPASFLLVQGPLGLNWRWRKAGLLPRIENADLTPANPPTLNRLRLWIELNIHVLGRPEWVFAKLHTHGGIPRNMDMFLGAPMRRFIAELRAFAHATPGFQFHFATAREMVNIIHAAEAGHNGSPADFRDFRYISRISHPAPAESVL